MMHSVSSGRWTVSLAQLSKGCPSATLSWITTLINCITPSSRQARSSSPSPSSPSSLPALVAFGLVTYAAEQRTKEIGIRKVLGVPGSPASSACSAGTSRCLSGSLRSLPSPPHGGPCTNGSKRLPIVRRSAGGSSSWYGRSRPRHSLVDCQVFRLSARPSLIPLNPSSSE